MSLVGTNRLFIGPAPPLDGQTPNQNLKVVLQLGCNELKIIETYLLFEEYCGKEMTPNCTVEQTVTMPRPSQRSHFHLDKEEITILLTVNK